MPWRWPPGTAPVPAAEAVTAAAAVGAVVALALVCNAATPSCADDENGEIRPRFDRMWGGEHVY